MSMRGRRFAQVSGLVGTLFALLSLLAFASPAFAGIKTVNGISAEVNLPNAQRGAPYSHTIVPSGGGGAPYTFQLTAGSLPAGYTLSSSGTVSGTTCSAPNGSYSFSVRITSSTGTVADFTGNNQFSVQMTAGQGSACSLTLAALPTTGSIGTPYSGTASVTGGTAPYTWSQTAGTLPPGLTLNTTNGTVSGTPTTAGTYSFTLRVADSTGVTGVRNYTVTIAPVISLSPSSLPNGLQSIAYSQTVSASDGTAPYTFTVTSGALPTGLSLGPTGLLSGTPTVAGTFNFTVTATDSGGFTGSRAYSLQIASAPTIAIGPAALPDGLQNKPYASQTIAASGGTAPYTYAVTAGSLPAGLSLSSAGVLSGTPTAPGTFNFTVTATDANTYTANRVYSISVTAQPTIVVDPVSLNSALQNLPYSQAVTASGGTAPYTFAVTSGALPAGLSLSGAGLLSGTPTASGTFNVTVTATDANTYTGSRAYTLTVTAAPTITISPASLPTSLEAQPYSQTVSASGGTGPYSFSISAGALPAGLTLAPGGLLTGTPTASGTFNFTVQATDANGYVATRLYSLVVSAAPTITLAPLALPDAREDLPYPAQNVTASGGTAPYTYAVTGGGLPAGMSLSSGGVLSGTPTASGTFSFTVTATDANDYTGSRAYTLVVIGAPTITLAPVSLPNALENKPYATQNVAASGGTAPYTYAITGGSLPAGLSFTSAGVLSGTPTQSGTFNFTVTVTDADGYTGNRSYSIGVTPEPTISVAPITLPDAFQNQVYATQTVTASGGTAPYTFQVTGGALPAGLTLASDGTLSGTPTASGTFNFTVTATDANDYTGSRSYTLSVTAQPTITVNPASLPGALQNQAYGPQAISASGGTAPYTFAVTGGALPAGLMLASNGTLSGTATTSGTFNFSVTATDTDDYTGSRSYALDVVAEPTITLAPTGLPAGSQGVAYPSQTITATGGTAPYSFAVTSGALPAGLTLASNGTLSGTATASGTFNFSVTATDADTYIGSRVYSISIMPASSIVVTPPSLPDAKQNLAYSQSLGASGGTAPYALQVTGGALPAGLALAANGALTGTPTVSGTFNFTVTATDSSGFTGAQGYTLDVAPQPTITLSPPSVPSGPQNQPYATQTLTASGGTAPYGFAVTGGALPAGLTLASDGTLSGTPTASGTFNFTVTATDVNNYTGSRAYSLSITSAPVIAISPASLPAALANQPYGPQAVSASGGTAPYAFAVTSGSLPAGLSLASDGTLSGTPTAAGTFSFTVTATDANGYTGARAYTLSVTGQPTITLAPLTLPVGLEGLPYPAQNIVASGGTAPHTYAITSGALPAGMTFDNAGVLSGTPSVGGTFSFTVTATDANGYAGSLAYTLTVAAEPTITLSPASLPTALENQVYAPQTISASGGTAPYTYAITSGALPSGMSFSSAGTLSGTPAGNGAFAFTVTATDANGYAANQSYTLDVTAEPAITLSPITLPNALQDLAYAAQSITASGGTAPYTYTVTGGALPTGMSLSSAGALSGTPTQSGTFNFTVTATDASGYTGSLGYSLDVTAAPIITLGLTTLPDGLQNQPYSQTIGASGGTAPYTYAITSGALPSGLTMASDGTLSGTPSAAGTFTFSVTATDANGYTGTQSYTLTVNPPLQAEANDPVPTILAGGAISPFIPVSATGGAQPYTYSISPGLPAGMSFDPTSGQISGTPTQSQPLTTYTVTVQDAAGETATLTFDMQVLIYTVSLTPASADLGRAGLPTDLTFVGAGGFAPYVFALESGSLPGGLSLDSGGHLTGRAAQAGTYNVQLRVTDANGVTAVQAVTLIVGEPRPDPTLDAGVQALQTAQAESIRRFASAQTENTVRRLEQLRNCSAPANQLNLQVGTQGSVPVGQLTQDGKHADCSQQRSTWVSGTAVITDGVNGGDSLTTDGVTVGMDVRVSDTLRLGAGLGYSNQGENHLAGAAKLSGDGYSALAYGSWKLQPQVYVEGLIGYGSATYDIDRYIAEEDVRAQASRDASHWFGSVGIAGSVALYNTFLQPYLRLDYQAATFDAYREHSVSSLALRYGGLDADTLRYVTGLRANWSIDTSFGSFEPMLRFENRGESLSGLRQHLEYADGLDGVDYTLRKPSGTDSSSLVGVGFGLWFLNGFSAELEYQVSFGSSDLPDEQSVGAIVNWAF